MSPPFALRTHESAPTIRTNRRAEEPYFREKPPMKKVQRWHFVGKISKS